MSMNLLTQTIKKLRKIGLPAKTEHRRYTVPPHITKRTTKTLKTNKQKKPELTENQAVGKSDNQGVKEETFFQTSKRGGDGQPGREDLEQGSSWRTEWSHICVQINWEEQLWSKADFETQGFKAGK